MKYNLRYGLTLLFITYLTLVTLSQVGNSDFLEFPDGSIYTCFENNDTCIFYTNTAVAGGLTSSSRIHTALILDPGCDAEDFELLTLVDTISNDFAGSSNLIKYENLFIEFAWYVKEDTVRRFFERFNFYDNQFQLLKSNDFESVRPSFKLLQAFKRDTLVLFSYNTASPDFHSIFTLNPIDTTFKRDIKDIDIGFISSIMYDSLKHQYNCFHSTGLAVLDTNFNLLRKLDGIDVHTAWYGEIQQLGDEIITYGDRRPDFEEHQLTFNVFDRDLNLLSEDTHGDLGERDYPFITSSIDITDSAIFTGGNLDIPFAWDLSIKPTEYIVSKYTLEKKLLWRKIYGGDVSYMMFGLTGTDDGGCLVYGSKMDETTNVRFPFIQKISSEGLITSTKVPLPSNNNLLKIIGNPAHQTLHAKVEFDISKDQSILIYNALGELVKSVPVFQGENRIPVYELPSGMYYVTLLDRDNFQLLETKTVFISN